MAASIKEESNGSGKCDPVAYPNETFPLSIILLTTNASDITAHSFA